ncbi:MAG TPA: hypothetical protein PKD17_17440, partial [Cellvibrionaceae bacterium]|nr:hypothetical protein [Cellvibrionaceae bacterium]
LRHGDNLQIGRIKLEYRTDSPQEEPAITPSPVAETSSKQNWGVLITLAVIAAAVVLAVFLKK